MTSHHTHDSSGMGLLSANPSLNLPSNLGLMNPGSTSKFSHQGSHGMPPIFGHGNRPAPPSSSRPGITPDETSEVLASFGLSSEDLDLLSRYPLEKITPKNLPQIILDLKRRRSEDTAKQNLRAGPSREPLRVSSDDTRPFRRDHFNDRSSGLDTVVDYGHGSRSEDPAYRDRLEFEGRLRERERLRKESFRSDAPSHKVDNDYKPMGFSQSQERSMHEKTKGMPSDRKIDDFHGAPPKGFPYICSLCDVKIISQQNWNYHVHRPSHCRQRLQLLEIYPEWTGHGLDDSHTRQQSTNAAAGMHMGGGPKGRSGGHMGYLGTGPSHMKKGKELSRVVLVKGFEKGKRLKFELLKLAEPFGVISNFLILNDKNEALIEMSAPEEATAVRDYYHTNPAIILGKRVGVYISSKIKRIKKPDGKSDHKPDEKADDKLKPELGSVVHLSNLPESRYSNDAVIKLAEAYGKVKMCVLRMKDQAFIEMEKLEDAQTMVEQCAKVPLMFKGNRVNVEICSRYKSLIQKKLKQQQQREKYRKMSSENAESGNGENASSQMVATEDDCQEETDPKDSMTNSCEPELEDEDETDALMKTSSSVGNGAEMADTSEIDLKDPAEEKAEAQGPKASTPIAKVSDDKKKKTLKQLRQEYNRKRPHSPDRKNVAKQKQRKESSQKGDNKSSQMVITEEAKVTDNKKKMAHHYPGDIEDFVTVDDCGDEEAEQENEAVAQQESESADSPMTPESECAAETECPKDIGPFNPNISFGVDYVVPGFYCTLCTLFYTCEDVAKVTHCSKMSHYKKLKKAMNTIPEVPENKN
ncbi:matrin-3-like isoform X3 [Pseudophryne corroboree]|uniref:matrin-3-like isoform X3 n=1 Tax=Pseudophryne corroboree TaxID=495146 RepID=UPI0030818882